VAATRLCQLGDRARRAGVANTLVRARRRLAWRQHRWRGLVGDLTLRHRLDLRGRRTLLLGAGGAARGWRRRCWMPA
jgi:shikimate dehydrogenase